MQLSLRLPRDLAALSGLGSAGRAAQRALTLALAENTAPVAPDASATPTKVYLTPELHAGLVERGISSDDLREQAQALIYGWVLTQRKQSAPVSATDLVKGLPVESLRDLQLRLLTSLIPPLRSGRIVFAEASTGIGKSRVLALLAERQRLDGGTTTLVTPTIGLIGQLLDEFAALNLPAPAVYLGRAQFVSATLLPLALADPAVVIPQSQRDALTAWQGEPVAGSPSERMARHIPELEWLVEDLLFLAPDFPADAVTLDEAGEHESYEALRDSWAKAPVRLATHALLAAHIKLQRFGRNLIPDLGLLLVDEAHLLEDAISRSFSTRLSLHGLRVRMWALARDDAGMLKAMRLGATVNRMTNNLSEAIHLLSQSEAPGQYLLAAHGDQAERLTRLRGKLTRISDTLAPDLKKLSALNGTAAGPIREATEACRQILGASPVVVTLSRVRAYPSILIGPRGLRRVMSDFWSGVSAAALLSGTLFTDTAEHGVSAAYYSGLLHVPVARGHEVPRVIAPWIYTTPTLITPPKEDVAGLIPPQHDDTVDDTNNPAQMRYYDNLARVVMLAADTAVGGTLVLCTSYRAADHLAQRLSGLGDRLMHQRPGTTLAQGEQQFRSMAGRRPVWLAVGAAWTGLDLRDRSVEPSEDVLLTDVVVLRMPIMVASSVHAALRNSRTGLALVRIEASLRLRQGLGRLVRAEGQAHRRLWVADGRLWSAVASHRYLTALCLRAMDAYPKQEQWDALGLDR